MKRQALAVLLAATMVMGLAGCGSSKDAAATTDTAATERMQQLRILQMQLMMQQLQMQQEIPSKE